MFKLGQVASSDPHEALALNTLTSKINTQVNRLKVYKVNFPTGRITFFAHNLIQVKVGSEYEEYKNDSSCGLPHWVQQYLISKVKEEVSAWTQT